MKTKKIGAGLLCTCMVLSCMLPAQAAQTSTAQIWTGKYYVEGQIVCCKSADGKLMPLLNYDGSIYIPLRAAGEWMGKQVDWNAETRTISLSGSVTPNYCTDFDRSYDRTDMTPQVTIDDGIAVVVDGKKQELRAANGSVIYPLLYDNTSYLPMRAIGELINKEVTYVQFGGRADQPEIYIRTPLTDAQKTEAIGYVNQSIEFMKNELRLQREFSTALSGDNTVQATVPETNIKAALAKLDEVQKNIEQFKAIKQPSAPVTHANYVEIQGDLDAMLKQVTEIRQKLNSTRNYTEISNFLNEEVDDWLSRNSALAGEPYPGVWVVRMYITVTQDGTPCEGWE